MVDIVSQEEIDALLEGMEIQYNVPASMVQNLRPLQTLHETMGHFFEQYLSKLTHTELQIQLASIEESRVSYGASSQRIYFGEESSQEYAFIEIDSEIAFALLERMLGGVGEAWEERDELSAIEKTLFETMSDGLVNASWEAWKSVVLFEDKMVRKVSRNPGYQEEHGVVVDMHLSMGRTCGEIRIAYPFAFLSEIYPSVLSGKSEAFPCNASVSQTLPMLMSIIEHESMHALGQLMVEQPRVTFHSKESISIITHISVPMMVVELSFSGDLSGEGMVLFPLSLLRALETEMFGVENKSSESMGEEELRIFTEMVSIMLHAISRGLRGEDGWPSCLIRGSKPYLSLRECDVSAYAQMYTFEIVFTSFSSQWILAVDAAVAEAFAGNYKKGKQ